MKTLCAELEQLLSDALAQEKLGDWTQEGGSGKDAVRVVAASDLRFGDYQSNVAMVLSKRLGMPPRELAGRLAKRLEGNGVAVPEVAGAGFLNFRVLPEVYAARLGLLAKDKRLGVCSVEDKRCVVIDFSSPNVAKPMHVGHIRSTIIGECLSRVASFLGHHVISDNHLGDWGTQFGMVLWAWKRVLDEDALVSDALGELLRLYRYAKENEDANEGLSEAFREELVKLQGGDEGNLVIWSRCVELSRQGLQKIYRRLDVAFDHWLGESYYHRDLAPLVERLMNEGIARETDGAVGVFSDETIEPEKDPFKKREGKDYLDFPMLIRKRDGGFNYATTDLATLEYRLREWSADLILYVVDHRQSLHFRQLFEITRRLGHQVELCHVSFGTILGKDGKPLKTRAGDLPQLADLLDEAVNAARKIVEERSVLEEEQREGLAELLGLSAVKFMELSHHRMSDYVFDMDAMVRLDGDTAPYLQYSYARCRSILRKAPKDVDYKGSLILSEKEEIHLTRCICRFGEVVPTVMDGYRPNVLASYLLDLARAYHSFFQNCPVLRSSDERLRTRLLLCELTAHILEKGLDLLTISVPERM